MRHYWSVTPDLDEDALVAIADLVGRTGATDFKIGYLHDDVPASEAGWYAYAQYTGARISQDDLPGPVEAANALAERLLRGAACKCGRNSEVGGDDPDLCHWRRVGPRWYSGCEEAPGDPEKRFEPEGDDELHTTEILARALEAAEDPELAPMIRKARAGYYHDFLSPLALPEMQLVADLKEAGHPALAQRVADGEFDSSTAESRAWGESDEGKSTFAELVGSTQRPPGPNRADRRKAKKKRR